MIAATPEARILCNAATPEARILCNAAAQQRSSCSVHLSVLTFSQFSPLLRPHNSWRRVSIPPIRRLRVLKTQRPCQDYRLVVHPERVEPQVTDGECQRRLKDISVWGGDMLREECARGTIGVTQTASFHCPFPSRGDVAVHISCSMV